MTVTITYFPLLAKGLAPMLVLEQSGVEWKGEAVAFPDWAALKASGKCPFGQLPILETDDVGTVGQSSAICAYVGRKAGLMGATDAEKMTSDMLVGMGDDIYMDMVHKQNTCLKKDKASAEEVALMWSQGMPPRFACLEKLLNGKDKFSEAGTTVGEFVLFSSLHQAVLVKPEALKPTPSLSSFYTRVLNLPSVQKVLTGKSAFGAVAPYFVE